jgi:hypothetical protein
MTATGSVLDGGTAAEYRLQRMRLEAKTARAVRGLSMR